MNTDWKLFLEKDAGAVSNNGKIEHFGNFERELRVATAGNTFLDLSHLGLIAVHGEDAEEFMQNLFCNDVRDIDDSRSQLSAICSPKGRIIASFRLFKRSDSYYLQLPASMIEMVLKRLKMFVLRSKVEVTDASDRFIRIGCTGPTIEEELTAIIGDLPANPGEVITRGELTIVRVEGRFARFELFGDLPTLKEIWNKLDVKSAPVGHFHWQLHDILAGIPSIYPDTSEAFVPQAANFKELNGLSFTKGCYPGQEVVARTQYLGKIKRRMYLAHIEGDSPALPGTEVIDAKSKDKTVVGKVVDCQPSPDDGFDLLAVLQIEAAEKSDLILDPNSGETLKICKLPYKWADE